jgi:hypothetical protein
MTRTASAHKPPDRESSHLDRRAGSLEGPSPARLCQAWSKRSGFQRLDNFNLGLPQ